MRTLADLSVEKGFSVAEDVRSMLYVQVENLFNQQDLKRDRTGFDRNDYARWGLAEPRPTDNNFIKYGDPIENTRHEGSPRQIRVGFRLQF